MAHAYKKRKVICIGGSYFQRVRFELEKAGFIFVFLTNVQMLYSSNLTPRKREIKRNFFETIKNELNKNTLILLNLTGNSLFVNQCKKEHHNPENTSGFDNYKTESYIQCMMNLLRFLIQNLKNKGMEWTEMKERIVILPTSPRFIYTCCQDPNHHTQDLKTIHDRVSSMQLQLKNHFIIENVSMIRVVPLRHWTNFILINLDIDEIFCADMEFLKKLCKRNFTFSFQNLGGNKTAQKIILKYVLDLEKDNGLHIKSDYNKLWIDYLHCLKTSDYPINAVVTRKLLTYYNKLKE
jgi:hypothetical protein